MNFGFGFSFTAGVKSSCKPESTVGTSERHLQDTHLSAHASKFYSGELEWFSWSLQIDSSETRGTSPTAEKR